LQCTVNGGRHPKTWALPSKMQSLVLLADTTTVRRCGRWLARGRTSCRKAARVGRYGRRDEDSGRAAGLRRAHQLHARSHLRRGHVEQPQPWQPIRAFEIKRALDGGVSATRRRLQHNNGNQLDKRPAGRQHSALGIWAWWRPREAPLPRDAIAAGQRLTALQLTHNVANRRASGRRRHQTSELLREAHDGAGERGAAAAERQRRVPGHRVQLARVLREQRGCRTQAVVASPLLTAPQPCVAGDGRGAAAAACARARHQVVAAVHQYIRLQACHATHHSVGEC
jgi:hypothetical protein